jgi:hypothetical protein
VWCFAVNDGSNIQEVNVKAKLFGEKMQKKCPALLFMAGRA